MPRHTVRSVASAIALIPLLATACLPYTVGSTAQTVPTGKWTRTSTNYIIPQAVKGPGDSVATPMWGSDLEYRHGLDARSDLGLRMVPGGGVINYKRRMGSDTSHARASVAFMTGAGIVNLGEHAHFEATLIASGRQNVPLSAYGGIRAMQVVPLSTSAVNDSPTVGAFAGLQIGGGQFTLRPELGVFYDRSALELRTSNVIFVPALSIQRNRDGGGGGGGSWLPGLLGWLW
jgi:hypothetical protein